jgi:hypothetical protein
MFRIILSIQFAAVGLYDSANAIQTKSVMALADFPKRLTGPIVGGQVKLGFRFLERKEESVIVYFGSRNKYALVTCVHKGIGKKLGEGFLQKLRINV